MTAREATGLLLAGFLLIAAGLVWMFGPYGLIAAGVVACALSLFGIDVKEHKPRGEAVAAPHWP